MSTMQQHMSARQQFVKEHGSNQIKIGRNGMLNFADGARIEQDAWGAMLPPPADPYERAKLIHAYHEELARRAEAAFNEKKNTLSACLKNNPVNGLPDGELESLKELQKEVRRRRAALKKAEAALDAAEPAAVRNQQNTEAERRERNERILGELNGIKI